MKHMKITNPRIRYLTMFLFLLLTELFIGIFVHDRFIRPYAGDVLVVILIYTFLRALFPHGVKNLVWYELLFAVCVEILQYFHIGSGGNGANQPLQTGGRHDDECRN